MLDILEARARELARRGLGDKNGSKTALLVSDWPEERFGFDPSLFSTVLETEAAPCPTGVVFNGLPCCGFIYHHGFVYPTVSWAALLGIEPPQMPIFAVTYSLGFALELAGPCRIEKVDPKSFQDVNRPFCRQRIGDLYLGNLDALP